MSLARSRNRRRSNRGFQWWGRNPAFEFAAGGVLRIGRTRIDFFTPGGNPFHSDWPMQSDWIYCPWHGLRLTE